MERMPLTKILAQFMCGSAIAFLILYFFTGQLPVLAIVISLLLISIIMTHLYIDDVLDELKRRK